MKLYYINNSMKTIILILILFSSQVSAWCGPGCGPGFYPGMGWGGMPYGYMYPPLQYPTFNYQQTVVVQQPQVIERVIEPQPRVIIEERRVIDRYSIDENERLRRYFGK